MNSADSDQHGPLESPWQLASTRRRALLARELVRQERFFDALDRHERGFKKLLDERPENHDQIVADLESIERFRQVWGSVEQWARCLGDFAAWQSLPPSRRSLFERLCRHGIDQEWDGWVNTGSLPAVFPDGEKLAGHLAHCHLCQVMHCLAECRQRGAQLGGHVPWGDELVRAYLERQCRQAVHAIRVPRCASGEISTEILRAVSLADYDQVTPLELLVEPSQIAASEDDIWLGARVRSGSPLGKIELYVTGEYIDLANHGLLFRQMLYPNLRRPSPHLDAGGQASIEVSLTTRRPEVSGRLLIRLAGRSRSDPDSPERVEQRIGAVRTRGPVRETRSGHAIQSQSTNAEEGLPEQGRVLMGTGCVEFPGE